MKYKNQQIEILAPAGSFASLHAAINAGADAVYFGISQFNMRATAAVNFTLSNLSEVVNLCQKHKIKTYVTVNTLLYNEEIDKMKEIVDAAKKVGVTAIIAADMATISYAREQGVDVNISTQLSISNTQSLKFYAQFADVIVLARELSLKQVKQICQDILEQNITGPKGELVKIEIFVHGALCVAVSGRCGMSLYSNGTSANRGKCSQVCRRKFKVIDNTGSEYQVDNNYIMSSSDLCTIGMLPELLDTGVSILKFEGRGRSPEYVDTVIQTYKEAINSINADSYSDNKIKQWNTKLSTVFNRGLSRGMYHGIKFSDWAKGKGSQATHEKIQIGIVQKYYPKIQVVQILIQAKETITIGEKYLFIGKKSGIIKGTITDLQIDEKKVKKASQGDIVTFKLATTIKNNDEFYVVRKKN